LKKNNEDQIKKNKSQIEIEGWYQKQIKNLQKDKEKTLEIKRIITKLKSIIYHKIGLKDEIEDK
jgi:hypothetical protein